MSGSGLLSLLQSYAITARDLTIPRADEESRKRSSENELPESSPPRVRVRRSEEKLNEEEVLEIAHLNDTEPRGTNEEKASDDLPNDRPTAEEALSEKPLAPFDPRRPEEIEIERLERLRAAQRVEPIADRNRLEGRLMTFIEERKLLTIEPFEKATAEARDQVVLHDTAYIERKAELTAPIDEMTARVESLAQMRDRCDQTIETLGDDSRIADVRTAVVEKRDGFDRAHQTASTRVAEARVEMEQTLAEFEKSGEGRREQLKEAEQAERAQRQLMTKLDNSAERVRQTIRRLENEAKQQYASRIDEIDQLIEAERTKIRKSVASPEAEERLMLLIADLGERVKAVREKQDGYRAQMVAAKQAQAMYEQRQAEYERLQAQYEAKQRAIEAEQYRIERTVYEVGISREESARRRAASREVYQRSREQYSLSRQQYGLSRQEYGHSRREYGRERAASAEVRTLETSIRQLLQQRTLTRDLWARMVARRTNEPEVEIPLYYGDEPYQLSGSTTMVTIGGGGRRTVIGGNGSMMINSAVVIGGNSTVAIGPGSSMVSIEGGASTDLSDYADLVSMFGGSGGQVIVNGVDITAGNSAPGPGTTKTEKGMWTEGEPYTLDRVTKNGEVTETRHPIAPTEPILIEMIEKYDS